MVVIAYKTKFGHQNFVISHNSHLFSRIKIIMVINFLVKMNHKLVKISQVYNSIKLVIKQTNAMLENVVQY